MRPEFPLYLRMKAAEMREPPLAMTLMFLVRWVRLRRLMTMLVRVLLVAETIRRRVLRLLLSLTMPISIGRVTLFDSLTIAVACLEPYLMVVV